MGKNLQLIMSNTKKKLAQEECRFECQKCGYCCSEKAIIYPSHEEILHIAEYMSISILAFAIRYLREIFGYQTHLYSIAFKTGKTDNSLFGCIFCRDKLCSIYNSARTDLCNVFPWNHFNIDKEKWDDNFITSDGKFWCPGIGKGREWSLDEIGHIKQTYPNFGDHTKRIYNPPLNNELIVDIIGSALTTNIATSELEFIQKIRSLSFAKKKEFEQSLQNL